MGLSGTLFEAFIINEKTDRYNIMCYIYANEREHQSSSYEYGISGGGCTLPITSTTKAL